MHIRPNFSVHPVGKTIRWIEKWFTPFMMDTTSSITMQSLGKIVRRVPAVGAETWCLYLFLLAGLPRSGKVPVFHRPKIRFFAPQGRLITPIQVKLCRTDEHLGPLGCAKFHVYRCRGVGMRPPK